MLITEPTFERRAEPLVASLDGNHPRPHLPGWIVTHVLRVPAFEVRHPVVLRVPMESDDPSYRHA